MENEPDTLYPPKVKSYLNNLIEILDSSKDFSSLFDNFVKDVSQHRESTKKRHNLLRFYEDPHPVLTRIYYTKKILEKYWQLGALWASGGLRNFISDVAIAGRALEDLKGIKFISPDEKELNKKLEEEFSPRLWDKQGFWNSLYELEIASAFEREDLNAKLICEGESGGPDILLDNYDQEIFVECKNKQRLLSTEKRFQKCGLRIAELLWSRHDFKKVVGDDHFSVEISGDNLIDKDHVEKLAESIAHLMNWQKESVKTTIDGDEFLVKVREYVKGQMEIELTPEGAAYINQFNEIMPEVIEKFADPLEKLGFEKNENIPGFWNFNLGKVRDDFLVIVNTFQFEFDVPWDFDFVGPLEEPIKKGRDQLSGKGPSVLYLNLPYLIFEKMKRLPMEDHRGETVSQWERFKQRIKGHLNESNSLNAIIITTKKIQVEKDHAGIGQAQWEFFNKSPEEPLPEDFKEKIKNGIKRF